MTRIFLSSGLLVALAQVIVAPSPLHASLAVQPNEALHTRECQNCELDNPAILIVQSDHRAKIQLLNQEAYQLFEQGKFQVALDKLEQVLTIARSIRDHASEGTALNDIGAAHLRLRQYDKAIDFNYRALAILTQVGDRQGEGRTLNNIGSLSEHLGQYPKALDYYQKSLAIAKEVGDRMSEGRILSNIGVIYRQLGQVTTAINYYQQALTIQKELDDLSGMGGTLRALGSAYRDIGEITKALNSSEQALLIYRKKGNRIDEADTLHGIGTIYHNPKQYPKALDYYQQALTIYKELGNRQFEAKTLNNIAAIYVYFEKSNQFPIAEKYLIDSIQLKESLSLGLRDSDKISLSNTQVTDYQFLQYVFNQQQKHAQALEVSERSRARAFIELLAKNLNKIPQNVLPAALSINDIQRIAKQQRTTLVQYTTITDPRFNRPELYIWVVSPTGKLDFRKVALSQNANASLSQQVQAVVAVAQTGFRRGTFHSPPYSFQLGMRVRLKDDMPDWDPWKILAIDPNAKKIRVQQLSTEKTVPFEAVAPTGKSSPSSDSSQQTLYRTLIQPIADLLPTDPNQRVIFIPQGALFNVPFAALMDEQGKYLIEKHTILTAPSIQTLDLTRQQHQRIQATASQGAVVMGNPTMPRVSAIPGEQATQLSNLPHAETEAKQIARLLNTTAVIGDAATKANLLPKLSNARVIHLATHGLLDDYKGNDIPGAIALAPTSSDDGLLRSRDILDLKLNAELVVLSACDTGKGKITGDGVLGLSRSLFLAGTPSVIVSLWQVKDDSTADLMTAFYQHWQRTGDKAVALRQAMLDTMKKYPNPRDWAAFTLIGEAE
jgi:CHAT domain-containing protein/tetratricopeptide (TPR) repeat protein